MKSKWLPFTKYSAVGNDYLVVESEYAKALTAEVIRGMCNRNKGIGADGVLISSTSERSVLIYNSDGSEAAKSGNGLRIFAYHLKQTVNNLGSEYEVTCKAGVHQVIAEKELLSINMKCPVRVFNPENAKWDQYREGDPIHQGTLVAGGRKLDFMGIDIGNPHCVLLNITRQDLLTLGPLVENHELFPERTNVQFLFSAHEHMIEIGVWERGSGHTLSSGSSSCAAFIAAASLNLCKKNVNVQMEGGSLDLHMKGSDVWMTGNVNLVADGRFSLSHFEATHV